DIANENEIITLRNKNTTTFHNKMNTERIYMKDFTYIEFEPLYRNYVKKHNQIIGDLLNPKHKNKKLPKVVVVQPDMRTGYGNRFGGIVCGFLYSIVSDRLFFMEGYRNFDDFFLLDFDHDWDVIKKFYFKNTSKYLHDVHEVNDFKLITNGNFKDVESFDILYVRTWDYACAPLMSNPNYKDWI
ncbi:7529_t:CDS:1, partial [Racocetra persica]